jgi:hypothetical protein
MSSGGSVLNTTNMYTESTMKKYNIILAQWVIDPEEKKESRQNTLKSRDVIIKYARQNGWTVKTDKRLGTRSLLILKTEIKKLR